MDETRLMHFESLWDFYGMLDNRVREILDLLFETIGIEVELGYYDRRMDFHSDMFQVGDYEFPTRWLWEDDPDIKKEIRNSEKYAEEREKAIREEELAELARLKAKYELTD